MDGLELLVEPFGFLSGILHEGIQVDFLSIKKEGSSVIGFGHLAGLGGEILGH